MSSEKAVVPVQYHTDCLDFIDGMLPASEKTALLFNISYLCLAKFPSLERIIRARAVESRMLFSSSEATLLKCYSTSDNMVKTLLPSLIVAVKEQDGIVAIKFLEKAKTWINNIIMQVDNTAKEYHKLNIDVASATSDVIETKSKTEKDIIQLTKEEEVQKKAVEDYKTTLNNIQSKLNEINADLNKADEEFQNLLESIASRNSKFGIATVVPIIGWIINSVQRAINDPKDQGAIDLAKDKLQRLQQDKNRLSNDEWRAQTELMKYQINLSRAEFEKGVVPNPTHLNEVQTSLSKIQNILIDLKNFWEKFGVMVNHLKDKTFAQEELVGSLKNSEYQEMFLTSLEDTEKGWEIFGRRCLNVMNSLNGQSKDAYKFLETSPSSLTQEEWQNQYDAVVAQLNSFNPTLPQLHE